MSESAEELYRLVLQGERRAISKLITMVEEDQPVARETLRLLFRRAQKAHVIGLTGPPGSGKSTLAARLAEYYRKAEKRVGIICVDPTSPFSGGALLGDRVRMQELFSDPGVFIRSMGTRGSLGGLAVATNDVISILDASGNDYIIVETVGAGQLEIEIAKYAHTCVVVLMPGGGDDIQAIKAGILEIGDIFVVNKAEREEASRTISDLQTMIETRPSPGENGWRAPVVATVAIEGRGISELSEEIENHLAYLRESGALNKKNLWRMKTELMEVLNQRVERKVGFLLEETQAGRAILEKLIEHEIDPHSAADEIEKLLLRNG